MVILFFTFDIIKFIPTKEIPPCAASAKSNGPGIRCRLQNNIFLLPLQSRSECKCLYLLNHFISKRNSAERECSFSINVTKLRRTTRDK